MSPGVRAAAAAVAFLTRVPVGRLAVLDERDVQRGGALFPVVGALIGAVVGGVALALGEVLPPLAAATCALAAGALLTGAMHLDALADAADALGARSCERALEIMRDPRIGSFGATALMLDLLAKAAAIAALVETDFAFAALVVAGAVSRAAAPPLACALPYARPSGGVLTGSGSGAAAVAVILGAVVALGAAGSRGAWMLAATAVVALALGLWCHRRLGGVTGDGLGATIELGETCALLVAAALV